MGDEDRRDGGVRSRPCRSSQQVCAGGSVEGAKRLVEQQQFGLQAQSARQADPLGFAARELRAERLCSAADPEPLQPVIHALV